MFARDRQVKNVRSEVADVMDLPYPGHSFDRTFCRAVLESSDLDKIKEWMKERS